MSRETGFSPEVREAILLRDAEMCGMQGHPLCRGGRADEANHRLNRQSGGDPRAVVNSPANGVALESGCNWRLEVNADFAEAARARGVKLDHSGDDPVSIVGTPMWSVLYRQWAVLRLDGMFLTGCTDSSLDARDLVVSPDGRGGYGVSAVNRPADPAISGAVRV